MGLEGVGHEDGRRPAIRGDLELFRLGQWLLARRDEREALELRRIADSHDSAFARARRHRQERAVRVPARIVERHPRNRDATAIAALQIEERELSVSRKLLDLRQRAPVGRQRAGNGTGATRLRRPQRLALGAAESLVGHKGEV